MEFCEIKHNSKLNVLKFSDVSIPLSLGFINSAHRQKANAWGEGDVKI